MQLLHATRTPTHSSYSALRQEIDAFTWVQMHCKTRSAHQHVNGAAHAVLLVLVMHDGPVVQKSLQQMDHQSYEGFTRLSQILVLSAVVQQTITDIQMGRHTTMSWTVDTQQHMQLCWVKMKAILISNSIYISLNSLWMSTLISIIQFISVSIMLLVYSWARAIDT